MSLKPTPSDRTVPTPGIFIRYEYFRTLKAHLKPGGLAVTWAPTDRVLASFLEVFPYAVVVDEVVLGSEQPIEVDKETITRRLADPFTLAHYQRVEADLWPQVTDLLAGRFIQQTPNVRQPARVDLNFDLYPRDEYMVSPQP